MRAAELWFSSKPNAKLLRGILTPVSWLYAAGWQAYLGIYVAGLKKAKEAHSPVICVGNLTVGGSGKTPVSLHIYELLRAMDFEVVISCSGYGSPAGENARFAPPGDLKAQDWGDEAAMLRWLRPEIPLVVGRDRVKAASLVHQEKRGAVMLMDDGFQHLPLKKHFTILLDESNPANSRCLPAGPYREPRMNRGRADLVIPGEFEMKWSPPEFVEPRYGAPVEIIEKKIQVLCALGRPDRFLKSLDHAGYDVVSEFLLPDHDPLLAGNLLAAVDREIPLVVTAKDWVKLKDRADIGVFKVWVALSEARIEPAGDFRELLHATLTQIR
jgi:tetraacyldisaccharide 4'-kinase